ncbi:hypothetical protein GCM10010869_35130 [Mesorhizobium tianshanense]|nr:hypothetical protein GCM10010869_35130 [Mesorhizobium tianshanense]
MRTCQGIDLVSIGISWPALNQVVCALRFWYDVTQGKSMIRERIRYAREPRKIPVVLSVDEVGRTRRSRGARPQRRQEIRAHQN